jgi:hypothetical protein
LTEINVFIDVGSQVEVGMPDWNIIIIEDKYRSLSLLLNNQLPIITNNQTITNYQETYNY